MTQEVYTPPERWMTYNAKRTQGLLPVAVRMPRVAIRAGRRVAGKSVAEAERAAEAAAAAGGAAAPERPLGATVPAGELATAADTPEGPPLVAKRPRARRAPLRVALPYSPPVTRAMQRKRDLEAQEAAAPIFMPELGAVGVLAKKIRAGSTGQASHPVVPR